VAKSSIVAKAPRPIAVSAQGRTHILDGDATGGGHGPGRNTPGKSEFPGTLTDDEIIDGVNRIANDPSSFQGGVVPTRGTHWAHGTIKGVDVRVIVDAKNRRVKTAYPYKIARNP